MHARPRFVVVSRFGVAILFFFGVTSCESPLADYSGYVAPRPYAIDCDSAWQHAATALKANGFVIAEVQRQTPGQGVVVGKRGAETMSIGVSCEADGVHVTPSGLTPFARNGMLIAFERVTESARIVRPPMGMEVSAELISGPESALYFRTSLAGSSTLAVHFRVANGGDRPMSLDTRNIRLRTSAGASVAAIDLDTLRQRAAGLATEIAPRLLTSAVLKKGQRVEGFLIFPEARYDAAEIPLIDVGTKEPEEFEVTLLHDS